MEDRWTSLAAYGVCIEYADATSNETKTTERCKDMTASEGMPVEGGLFKFLRHTACTREETRDDPCSSGKAGGSK